MKSFKQFKSYIEDSEKPKYAFNAHGSHAKHEKPKYAFNAHGSHAKQKISESVSVYHKHMDDYFGGQQPEHVEEQMKNLQDNHPLSREAKSHIAHYTSDSAGINGTLLKQKEKGEETIGLKGLDDSFTPSKVNLTTYSGIGFDPREVRQEGKSKAGKPVFMSPTYMSTTHDKEVALHFSAVNSKPNKTPQILQVETQPGQSIAVIGTHSQHPSESETLLPRDEHFEHISTTTYTNNQGDKVDVHRVRRIPKSEVIKD